MNLNFGNDSLESQVSLEKERKVNCKYQKMLKKSLAGIWSTELISKLEIRKTVMSRTTTNRRAVRMNYGGGEEKEADDDL